MTTLVIVHEVDDVEHWRTSTKREEYFGPLGITARTFIDPDKSNRVGTDRRMPQPRGVPAVPPR
jgi:hypothetical protein